MGEPYDVPDTGTQPEHYNEEAAREQGRGATVDDADRNEIMRLVKREMEQDARIQALEEALTDTTDHLCSGIHESGNPEDGPPTPDSEWDYTAASIVARNRRVLAGEEKRGGAPGAGSLLRPVSTRCSALAGEGDKPDGYTCSCCGGPWPCHGGCVSGDPLAGEEPDPSSINGAVARAGNVQECHDAYVNVLKEDVAKMGLVIVSHAALLSRTLRSHDLGDSLLRRDIARALAKGVDRGDV